MNLLNNKKYQSNSYFCTWIAQAFGRPVETRKYHILGRDVLNEDFVFGANGLATLLPEVRKDLLFVFDDGWDVGFGLDMGKNRDMFGSLEVNTEKFPSCTGTPTERLKKLNDMVLAKGWKGTGIWICSNGVGEKMGNMFTPSQMREYWSERLRWSRDAGIKYWKVDWGHYEKNEDFRRMLTELAEKIAPDLVVEQAGCCLQCSGIDDGNCANTGNSGRFMDWENEPDRWMRIHNFSQTFRSYDVQPIFSVPTTLDRVYNIMRMASKQKLSNCVINCEDEIYLGAVLGCNLGIMRSSICEPENHDRFDPENSFKRIDEVVRAVNWQSYFAPPFNSCEGEIFSSEDIYFEEHDFHDMTNINRVYANRVIKQGAPGVVSRNMPLPKVSSEQQIKPYVVACKNSTGAISVATLPRVVNNNNLEIPQADIEINAGIDANTFGVFGIYKSLSISFDNSMDYKHVMVQDLADNVAYDITDKIEMTDKKICISGDTINTYGLKRVTEGDLSYPGLVVMLK